MVSYTDVALAPCPDINAWSVPKADNVPENGAQPRSARSRPRRERMRRSADSSAESDIDTASPADRLRKRPLGLSSLHDEWIGFAARRWCVVPFTGASNAGILATAFAKRDGPDVDQARLTRNRRSEAPVRACHPVRREVSRRAMTNGSRRSLHSCWACSSDRRTTAVSSFRQGRRRKCRSRRGLQATRTASMIRGVARPRRPRRRCPRAEFRSLAAAARS